MNKAKHGTKKNNTFINGLLFVLGRRDFRTDEKGARFRKIIIKPAVLATLDWVRGSFASASGNIISEWKKEDGRVVMNNNSST